MTRRWEISSPEAEEAVVGGVLVHAKAIDACLGIVLEEDFADLRLRAIWEAIVALDKASLPVDAVSVWQHMQTLGSAGRIKQHGGMDYLAELMGRVVTVENIGYHAGIIAKLAQRRRWATALRELEVKASDQALDSESFASEAELQVLELMMQQRSQGTAIGVKEGMKRLVDELERRFEDKDKPEVRGVPTGFYAFDAATGGFRPGQLIVLAARPRVGKSAWCGNAIEYASRRNIPVLAFSLEMGSEEYFERMIASNGIKADALRTGNLNQSDWVALTKTASDLSVGRMVIDDQAEITITELRSRARRWRSRAGAGELALITVDYMQLVKTGRRTETTREQEVAEVSRGLKALAKELKCPVIALSQLNREVDKRTNQRPKLSDLRESGAIEQDADIVLFLYREFVDDREATDEQKSQAELIIGKGRGLPEWPYKLRFDGAHTKFSNPK